MITIQIFEEDVKVQTRTIPAKEGKPPRNIYEQTAYAHLGGKFPTQMKLNLDEGQPPYVAGNYTLHPSSYVVNNFGSLELKRYGQIITPLDVDI